MAGTIVADTIQDGAGNSTAMDNAIYGSAKAWVNFNGVTTATIRASYNVSSITRNGTGDYTVNFTNALTDANYGVNTTSGQSSGSGTASSTTRVANVTTPLTTTSCRVYSLDPPQNTLVDVSIFTVSVFR
jgi:hypothetical protein